jgi:hypothetical protein
MEMRSERRLCDQASATNTIAENALERTLHAIDCLSGAAGCRALELCIERHQRRAVLRIPGSGSERAAASGGELGRSEQTLRHACLNTNV